MKCKFTSLCFLLLISLSAQAQVKLRRICKSNLNSNITVVWYQYKDTCTAVEKIVIYARTSLSTPFKAIDSLANGSLTDYVHVGGQTFYQSGYYFIKYVVNCGGATVIYSDTMQVDQSAPNTLTPDSVSVINGHAVFGWVPNNAPNTEGYLLFKVTGSVNTVVDTIYGAGSNFYSDIALSDNPDRGPLTYKFAVFDSCINISSLGNPVQTIFLNLSQDTCKRQISLSWSKYVGWPVDSYEVFLYNNPYNAFVNPVKIGTVSGLQTTFTYQVGFVPNRDYYFMVRAIKSGAPYSGSSSNVAMIQSLFAASAGYLYIRKVSVVSGRVEIVWTVQYPQVISYFEVTKGQSNAAFYPLAKVFANGSATYTYIDSNMDPYKDISYYQIQAFNVCGAAAGTSNVSNNILLEAYNIPKGRSMIWNPYNTWIGGVRKYDILRSNTDTSIGAFDNAGTDSGALNQFSDFTVIDTTGNLGFCYYVQAIEGPGDTLGFIDTANSNVSCIIEAPIIYFPNALIKGGINKTFQPSFLYVDFSQSSYQIYNRWGAMIATGDDVRKGWDEKADGEFVESGVYFYYYKITGLNKEVYYYKGTISVL